MARSGRHGGHYAFLLSGRRHGRLMKKAVVVTGVAALVVALGLGAWRLLWPGSNALWSIVSTQCVPQAQAQAAQNVCVKVDLAGGYAVLKDIRGAAQYLLIPTRRIGGIESAALLDADAPNYWRDAWQARGLVEQALHAPLARDEIGLAINSYSGRSQNQLHIHIDCMRPDVVAALAAQRGKLSEQWTDIPQLLAGQHYRARLIAGNDLGAVDPFKLLYKDVHAHGGLMASQTLLLTGTTLADGQPGFILLNDHVRPGSLASAEALLDHECRIAPQKKAAELP
jgi:CDP-diacylglycerol pyrophosphatase